MSHARIARIPIEHLASEVAAYPLASEAAFRTGLCQLDPQPAFPSGSVAKKELDQAEARAQTAVLWRDAEKTLISRTPALSIDELVALRDELWFPPARRSRNHTTGQDSGDCEGRVSLAGFLEELSCSFLRSDGPVAAPCLVGLGLSEEDASGEHSVRARSRDFWRWVSFALPPDLLLAGLSAGGPDNADVVRVEEMAPQLQEMLARKQFAETHLHVGAAIDFPSLWISAQLSVLSGKAKQRDFRSPCADFGEGREFADWILRATFARYCLAVFLHEGVHDGSSGSEFTTFYRQTIQPRMLKNVPPGDARQLTLALRELASGRLFNSAVEYERICQACGVLTCVADRIDYLERQEREGSQLLPALHQVDPIAAQFPPIGAGQPSCEVRLIRKGLLYLNSRAARATPDKPNRDRLFESLFWQTIRVRCLYYRHVVQRPMTPGLQWFTRTYGRIGPGRRAANWKATIESGVFRSGAREGLRSLELRTSPSESLSEALIGVTDVVSHVRMLKQKHLIASASSAADDQGRSGGFDAGADCSLEAGLVLHLCKERGGNARAGLHTAHWLGTHADPQSELNRQCGYRYASYFRSKQNSLDSLATMLTAFPLTLSVVRGIDVCTDELGVPTWVIWPMFRYVREASKQASSILKKTLGLDVPPLRSSVHAGEDFTHLLGGLRRIDEAIRYLRLSEGDRLGHCVALGVDATEWARSAGIASVPIEERLFDLSWEWSCYARFDVPAPETRKTYLEREISRLAQRVFRGSSPTSSGRMPTPLEVESLIELLHHPDEDGLRRIGFPGNIEQGRRLAEEEKLKGLPRSQYTDLFHFLSNPDVFRRGRRSIFVDPAREAEALENLQRHLRKRIASLGLTVEVNPSSNLLIGDLSDLRQHPLWRLNPPEPIDGVPPVAICVGSDDPLTFATRLPREYGLIFDSLVLAGVSHVKALEWIDQVRETSLRCRFTLPLSFPARHMLMRSRLSDRSPIRDLLR